jgi:hypothetical protein
MQSNTDILSSSSGVRKRMLPKEGDNPAAFSGEIDIASHAVLAYTSDDPDHPIDNLIDGHYGRGSTFWAGAKPNTVERIIVEFDQPQSISWMIYEVEDCACARTQEVSVEVSLDGGPHLPADAGPGVHLQPCRCDLSARSAAPEPAPDQPPSLNYRPRQTRLGTSEIELAAPVCLRIELEE